MSFLSEHIAKETGQPEPVAGPSSPHFDAPHHYHPPPAKETGRVIMGQGAGGMVVEVNEHPELERKRAIAAALAAAEVPASDRPLPDGAPTTGTLPPVPWDYIEAPLKGKKGTSK